MPTDEQIEAAARGLYALEYGGFDYQAEWLRSKYIRRARAALTAAQAEQLGTCDNSIPGHAEPHRENHCWNWKPVAQALDPERAKLVKDFGELSQDVAFIAFTLDRLLAERAALLAIAEAAEPLATLIVGYANITLDGLVLRDEYLEFAAALAAWKEQA